MPSLDCNELIGGKKVADEETVAPWKKGVEGRGGEGVREQSCCYTDQSSMRLLRELYKSSIGNNRSGKRPVLSPIILSMPLSIYASISILEGTATVLSSAMAIFF